MKTAKSASSSPRPSATCTRSGTIWSPSSSRSCASGSSSWGWSSSTWTCAGACRPRTLDGETANSWEYCRQWIDRVEPFFVCILGQRYGWVPEPRALQGRAQTASGRNRTAFHHRSWKSATPCSTTGRKRRSYFYLRATRVPHADRATSNTWIRRVPGPKLERLKARVRHCGRPCATTRAEWTGQRFRRHGRVRSARAGRSLVGRVARRTLREQGRLAAGARHGPRQRPALHRRIRAGSARAYGKRSSRSPSRRPRTRWTRNASRWTRSPPRGCAGSKAGRDELQQLTDFIGSTDADRPAPRRRGGGARPRKVRAARQTLNSQSCNRSNFPHHPLRRRHGTFGDAPTRWSNGCSTNSTAAASNGRRTSRRKARNRSGISTACACGLRKRLGDYAGERRIVILLDALNQLSDGHDLHWLPQRLGPSVRVVVSCVDDPAAKADSPEATRPARARLAPTGTVARAARAADGRRCAHHRRRVSQGILPRTRPRASGHDLRDRRRRATRSTCW